MDRQAWWWRWTDWQPAGCCEVCRRWCRGGLCAGCVARYAAPVPRCGRCAQRTGRMLAACGECQRDPPPFEHAVAAADYAFPWDRLVAALKFRGRVELAPLLAARVAAALDERGARPSPDLVLPMPLADDRLAARGFNQAWEIARRIAPTFGLRADATLLQRPLPGSPQAGLPRAERLAHLRGAFMVDPRRRAALQGARVALVDDVLTTGATAREATATLRRAGAAAVEVWVVARTP